MQQQQLFSITKAACLILFTFFLIAGKQSFAQTEFEVPENAEMSTKADYEKYESAVVEAAKWLEETDLNKEPEKRQKVNAFVVQWITGTPTLSIGLDQSLLKIVDKNPPLLALYMASYARYMIESKTTGNSFAATKAALTSVITVYKKGNGVEKNKLLDKLSKMDDNAIDDYITKELKVQKG